MNTYERNPSEEFVFLMHLIDRGELECEAYCALIRPVTLSSELLGLAVGVFEQGSSAVLILKSKSLAAAFCIASDALRTQNKTINVAHPTRREVTI